LSTSSKGTSDFEGIIGTSARIRVGRRFIELSAVGRVVDGEDEEESQAIHLDGQIVWEAEERSRRSRFIYLFPFVPT